MELRALQIAIRVLDPRRWRRRLAQLAGGVLAACWVWFRAVDHAPVDRAVRDAKRSARRERIRSRNAALESDHLAAE